MIREVSLVGVAMILFAMTIYNLITIRIAIVLFACILVASQYDRIYQSWVEAKERDAFQIRMGSVIEKINEQEAPAIQTIPRIIIQIWVQKGGGPPKIPANQIEYMEKMRKMNPSFQYMFFNGDDVDEFFKNNYAEYYSTYQNLPEFIQKLDFFRYLAIYHYGGFYFDTDVEPNKPLDESILNHTAVFPVDEYANSIDCKHPRMNTLCLVGQNFLLGQYAFAAVAKHPFMKWLVDKIHRNVQNYIRIYQQVQPNGSNVRHYFVYKTTGPDFVTDCYVEYSDKSQFYILSNGRRQVFGDYGVHKFIGGWK